MYLQVPGLAVVLVKKVLSLPMARESSFSSCATAVGQGSLSGREVRASALAVDSCAVCAGISANVCRRPASRFCHTA